MPRKISVCPPPPHRTFSEGPLVEVTFRVLEPRSTVTAGVFFSQEPPASFGDVDGTSVPGTARVVVAPLFADGFESGDTSAWSFVVVP